MIHAQPTTNSSVGQRSGLFTRLATRVSLAIALTVLFGCALPIEPEGPPRKENIFAVTQSNRLISFNAGQPARLLGNRPLSGLKPGDRVIGIDYRVARGRLYALGSSGQLYLVDPVTAASTPVGNGLGDVDVSSGDIAFDFNPTVDRIRLIVGRANARAHPDTGRLVDSNPNEPGVQIDGRLAYSAADANHDRSPKVVAAAYTYNKVDEKLTTNYAIDAAAGSLVTIGTIENVHPAVSPNTGQLFTVGPLNVGAIASASFDIADLDNAAFAAITAPGARRSRWYLIDLATGAASALGTIGGSETIVGVAIEP